MLEKALLEQLARLVQERIGKGRWHKIFAPHFFMDLLYIGLKFQG